MMDGVGVRKKQGGKVISPLFFVKAKDTMTRARGCVYSTAKVKMCAVTHKYTHSPWLITDCLGCVMNGLITTEGGLVHGAGAVESTHSELWRPGAHRRTA